MVEDLKSKTSRLRREHILAAAVDVFAERGYRSATIRDIAKAAGVADGTIYNAFANKAELLLSLIEPLADRLPGSTSPSFANDPETMALLLRDRLEALDTKVLEMLRVVLSEALVDPEIRKLFYDRVISVAVGPVRSSMTQLPHAIGKSPPDPDLASRTIVAAVLGLAVLRMLGDKYLEESWSRIPETLASLFSNSSQPVSEA